MDNIYFVGNDFAFKTKELADEFARRTGYEQEDVVAFEIMDKLPSSFRFSVVIGNGKVIEVCHIDDDSHEPEYFRMTNPMRVIVELKSPDVETAKKEAVEKSIEFLKKYKSISLHTIYDLDTGEMVGDNALMPLLDSMREQAISILLNDEEGSIYWNLVTTLNFWATPSNEDGLYHFVFKETGRHGEWYKGVTDNAIRLWSGDEELFRNVAEEQGFKLSSSKGEGNGSHELIMDKKGG